MMLYYHVKSVEKRDACLDAINSSPYWPITHIGPNGPLDDDSYKKTLRWCTSDDCRQLKNGEWLVPKIPDERLDKSGEVYSYEVEEDGEIITKWTHKGFPQEERESFLAAFGPVIDANESDLIPLPEVIEDTSEE